MQLDTVLAVGPTPNPDQREERWKRFWRPYESESIDPRFRYRPFTDGGVLDNKPFSLATAALRQRRLDLPVERRLFYVEPSPEKPQVGPAGADTSSPSPTLPVLKATKMAAWDLRGAEPIRADLDRLAERNARLDEMDAVLRDLELLVSPDSSPESGADAPPDAQRQPSPDADLTAYRRLRVDLATERLLAVLRPALNFDPRSAEARGLDVLVRAWRAIRYDDEADFLVAFDVAYELRRLTYLEQRLRTLTARTSQGGQVRSAQGLAEPGNSDDWTALRSEARSCAAALGRASVPLRGLAWSLQDPAYAAQLARARGDTVAADRYTRLMDGLEVLRRELQASSFMNLVVAPWLKQPEIATELLAPVSPLLMVCNKLAEVVEELVDEARQAASQYEEQMWSTGGQSGLVGALQWYARSFATFDRTLLPLVFGTELGEAQPVEVNRISPLDSEASGKGQGRQLFGESYGHFGAFLREDWRRLDLVSGRLDGASKIIKSLLPPDASMRAEELIGQAHTRILEEEYAPGGLLRDLEEPPTDGNLRKAFWDLRVATSAKHGLTPADWVRQGQKMIPSLRVSVESEVKDPWGARLSTAINLAWKTYNVYAGLANAQQRAQATVKAVARRVGGGPGAIRRWITRRSRGTAAASVDGGRD
jgi:patatin-related protein